MSSISGIPGGVQPTILSSATPKKSVAVPMVRDSDGDFDGTAVGKSDAKDLGKGVSLDRKA